MEIRRRLIVELADRLPIRLVADVFGVSERHARRLRGEAVAARPRGCSDACIRLAPLTDRESA